MFCTRSAQDVLLGVGERGALRLDVGLGRLGVGHRLAAAEQRLDHLKRRETAVQDVISRRDPDGNGVLLDLVILNRERHPGPPVGDGLGERFIGLAQQRTAGQQVGVAVVGRRQRLNQALRPGIRSGPQPDREGAHRCCAR
jgi:hypothetical protein